MYPSALYFLLAPNTDIFFRDARARKTVKQLNNFYIVPLRWIWISAGEQRRFPGWLRAVYMLLSGLTILFRTDRHYCWFVTFAGIPSIMDYCYFFLLILFFVCFFARTIYLYHYVHTLQSIKFTYSYSYICIIRYFLRNLVFLQNFKMRFSMSEGNDGNACRT